VECRWPRSTDAWTTDPAPARDAFAFTERGLADAGRDASASGQADTPSRVEAASQALPEEVDGV
jgi:hypothetical protein